MSDSVVKSHNDSASVPKAGVGWGHLSSTITALNPILLLVVGYYLNSGIEAANKAVADNTAKINDLKTQAETSAIVARERVDKVKVISDFLNDLSGPDERRRRLAIEAIFIALPDEATRFVKVVEDFRDKDSTVSAQDVAAAKDALANRRKRLVLDMFSLDKPVRVEALTTLKQGWADDAEVVGQLIDRAMQDVNFRKSQNWARPTDDDVQGKQRLASIYNTIEFLTYAHVPWDDIKAFVDAATPNSDDTRRLAAMLRERAQATAQDSKEPG